MTRARAASVLAVLLAPALLAHEASFLIHGAVAPVDSVSEGHVQTVTPVGDGWQRLRVSVPLTPIGARGSWEGLRARTVAPDVPAGFVLPAALQRRLRPEAEAWEVASEILSWVAASVVLDPDDLADQDATSVLDRRRGRCSGLANAATALLRAAGFEARTVSGLLIDGEVGIPHRWLECKLPGVGWVASDPTLGLWLVTPRHVVFPAPVVELPEIRVERVDPLDIAQLPLRDGHPHRPNTGAELVCRLVDDAGPALAVLSGPAGDVRRVLASPEARFERLFPGRWRLEVVRQGVVVGRLTVQLRTGEIRSCLIPSSVSSQEVES